MTQLKGQQALIPPPNPPTLARAEHYATTDKARFPIQPKGGGACSECVWICHEANLRGEKAPLPRPARFHWGTRVDRVDLCDGHKQLWEAEIKAAKKAAEAAADLAATTRRAKR